MPYDHLVTWISQMSGYPKCAVRAILAEIPDALMEMDEGEFVRTPLGVFRMVRKVARLVNLPGSEKRAVVKERFQVRLDPGTGLKRDA